MEEDKKLKYSTEECAIIPVTYGCLGFLFSSDRNGINIPIHGIRDITILDVINCKNKEVFYFLVWSRDIPSYIAFHKIMYNVEYMEYPSWALTLPMIGLTFKYGDFC